VASTTDTVRIHYHRPPDRHDVFGQRLLERTPDCVVTFMERTPLAAPVVVNGETVLSDGSPVIWFTFPGCWHDIGLFHTPEGRPTGTYANILTPVRFLDELTWETTDLCLDIWLDPMGGAFLLDADELEEAVRRAAISAELSARAHAEAARILRRAAAGDWPPAPVAAWDLARARHAARASDGTSTAPGCTSDPDGGSSAGSGHSRENEVDSAPRRPDG
jgi:predicted RNA-binding protein associated with RNAse of E/G family